MSADWTTDAAPCNFYHEVIPLVPSCTHVQPGGTSANVDDGRSNTDIYRSMSMIRTTLKAILIAVGTAFALSACNTIHGAGQDVEKAGEKIQHGADNTKRNMQQH